MVEGFREVRRVLRNDGTCWINLGDSYASAWACKRRSIIGLGSPDEMVQRGRMAEGLKEKDLCGIPWSVAFALRADGWYLRQDIIWSKPNPMPESVRDRCTKAHEYIFLLSKSGRYWYDSDAIAEPLAFSTANDSRLESGSFTEQRPERGFVGGASKGSGLLKPRCFKGSLPGRDGGPGQDRRSDTDRAEVFARNKRSVWNLSTKAFPEAHFATFPPEIPETCIKAGCPENGTVLDPFNGAGTTGLVATRLGRNYIGIELNPEYIAMATKRIENDAPLFNMGQAEAPQQTFPEATEA
jgi:DNA modification methylase